MHLRIPIAHNLRWRVIFKLKVALSLTLGGSLKLNCTYRTNSESYDLQENASLICTARCLNVSPNSTVPEAERLRVQLFKIHPVPCKASLI